MPLLLSYNPALPKAPEHKENRESPARRRFEMTKQPGKGAKTKAEKPGSPKASRFTSETVMRDVQRGLEQSLREGVPLSPKLKEEAQELAYKALEAQDREQARELAMRALAIDADCVDALVAVTALDATSPQQAIEGLEKAVAAGERALGAEFFKQNKGKFWGMTETRPYMRARHELAELLRGVGRNEAAIAHYVAMLELNPNDNQEVRYSLLGAYLTVGELERARRLLSAHRDDAMATFAWGHALERFLSEDLEGASTALKIARKQNPFVELHLNGEKEPPLELPESYELGSNEEALLCLEHLGAAWAEHPDAAMWLVEQLAAGKPARVSSPNPK
jgi:tetratricopeptide (TPR) repeat protein